LIKAIFVHLGAARAPWVYSNLKRHLSLFPEIPLVLISDHKSHLDRAAMVGVETYLYEPSFATNEVFKKTTHNNTFRHDFWRTSIERLIAIQQYQISRAQEIVLHIESDVILMPNFPWEKVVELKKLTWLNANSFSDCGALLYSPSIQSTCWLTEEIVSEINLHTDTTDMKALRSIREKHPRKINLFPSTTFEIADDLLKMDQKRYLENIELTTHFGGIFDVLNMGMWLTGQNPRNQGGKIIRYEKYFIQDNHFDSDSFTFEDNQLLIGTNQRTTVFNLHVHSKNPHLLSARWRSELSKLVNESRTLSRKRSFSVSGYLGSQYDVFVSVDRRIVVYLLILLKIDKIVSRIRARI
jgi:hypothetical protein